MLRTGREYLEGLRDGRGVYVGQERIVDVPSHPGFRAAAQTMAALYDLKCDAAYQSDLVVTSGEQAPYGAYFLAPRTREDRVAHDTWYDYLLR